jgi:shikimate dehydrogenase
MSRKASKAPAITGAARVGGIVGRPITHSLSPVLHNAWIAAAGLDAAYVPFCPPDEGFERFVRGLRGGAIVGLNVTAPFKERALAAADDADATARAAGSSNLLLFHQDGTVEARSTDGVGLIGAFAEQATAFDLANSTVAILGAGGAARAAAGALLDAGVGRIRVLNRTAVRAEELVFAFDDPALTAHTLADAQRLFADTTVVINAAVGGPQPPLDALPEGAVVMDMTYRPLMTGLLRAAEARGLGVVDGLSMLINQAIPTFEALFGAAPPPIDARAIALAAIDAADRAMETAA